MKKKKRVLICLIILVLAATAVLFSLLIHRARLIGAVKVEEQLKKAEEPFLRQQEELRTIAEKKAEEQEIASHVYSH